MKIARHYKPEVVASRSDDRFAISDPYLDVFAKRLVATDGYRLVAVPVEVEPGEASGYVSRELLQVGRKKAEKDQPVEIKDRIDLLPHEIQWPCQQGREFPNWHAVVPPYREGDEGTITIGLNARLLRGIADALGGDGKVALTVRIEEVGVAPIVVRAFNGDPGEVGILMPCRVDTETGEVAPPAPVMDLPPTEAEKKKDREAAGEDPDEPESMDLPGVQPGVPPSARLAWLEAQDGVHAASVPTGRYQVKALDVHEGWTATWAPWVGKSKRLAHGVDQLAAKEACQRHNLERLGDALLKNAGSGDLTRADTKGDAVARKPPKGGGR